MCAQIVGEQTFKINRFGRALQEVLGMAHDSATLELAAATLGHLVLSGGAVTADLVGSEVPDPSLAIRLVHPHAHRIWHPVACVLAAAEELWLCRWLQTDALRPVPATLGHMPDCV